MTPSDIADIKQELAKRQLCRNRVLPFVHRNVKDYEAGWIHQEICQKLEQFEKDVVAKKSPRLMLFMPPRHGKSELASTQFPAWFLGRNPTKEIISCSYSASLAMSFSRKVRELLRDPSYQSVFPKTILGKDSQSTENWLTTEGGGFLAAGVGGPITGRGAHCLIIDDPVKNRIDAESATEREKVWDWYSSTAYTRLAPGGGVLLILTRWHTDDLAGRLLNEMSHNRGDDWDIIVYPAVAVHDEEYRNIGDPLHPQRYDKEALSKIKGALTARDWGALYQQNPSTEEGAILKRDLWNRWEDSVPPECDYIIQSYDTAYGQSETSDFSVITTWGLFKPEGHMALHSLNYEAHGEHAQFSGESTHIILLDAVRGRFPFPELKERAHMLYNYWKPDSIIVEAKASGQPLMQEMRRMGIPVQGFSPSRGNDKMARVHSVSDLFTSGYVWAPRNEWADDLVEELHRFPAGKHDDQVDSTTQALMRFRQGGFITLATDDLWDEDVSTSRTRRTYY
tara:strand:+ start:3959 stop:5485 length:1527 start_codon:yes stop_codon:yes gene_type:complete